MIKGLWNYKILLDEIQFEVLNLIFHLLYLFNGGSSYYDLKKNSKLKNIHSGKRCFVIGNGPSIKNDNLKLLRDEITFFVNRSFLLDDYKYIKPTYHVIVDPKLGTGEWPIKFLDQIREINPDVTFILNAEWRHKDIFKPYLNWNIHWVYLKKSFTRFTVKKVNLQKINFGGAVVESAVIAAIYMGLKNIYLYGVEFNGLFYELLGLDSHFYGKNPENQNKSMYDISKDLMFHSIALRRWGYLNKYCKKNNINLKNLTPKGVLDIDRLNFLAVLKSNG